MRILHTEAGLHWGGQESRTLIECRWLNAHGHAAWAACNPDSEIFKRGLAMGAPVVPIPMRGSLDIAASFSLFQWVRERKIDVVHTHGSRDSWIAFPLHALGVPVIRSRHVTIPVRSGLVRSFIFRHGCRRIVATAHIIREALVQNNGVRPDKIDVVGEGIDLSEYHEHVDGTSFRREFNIPPDAPLVGIVGMMRGEKGHPLFVDAAIEVSKTHPNAHFVLVGEGVGGRRVERECRDKITAHFGPGAVGVSLGKRGATFCPILMTGYRQNVAEAIAALDILVAPSFAEARNRAIAEAFAMRKAVIASNVGGIPEVVRHEINGLLFPTGDLLSLANAIRRLLDDTPLRRRLADAGHATAQAELSLDKVMEQTLAVYQSVTNP